MAEEAASRSFSIEPDQNFTALAARAAIESAKHDFDAALASAEEALGVNPYDVGSLAIRIDTLTELGRYDDQLRALRIADRCIILDDGEVVFRGDPKTVLADETIRRDYLAV